MYVLIYKLFCREGTRKKQFKEKDKTINRQMIKLKSVERKKIQMEK